MTLTQRNRLTTHYAMEGETQPYRVVVLQGPTAAGKTALAHALADVVPAEIISADSRQLYRGMDIGTAKPSPDEQRRYHYHGIDLYNPDEQATAGEFARLAWEWIRSISARDRVPLIVGGSGLYIRAIVEGLFEMEAPIPQHIRQHLAERLQREGREALYRELQAVDPVSAARYADRNPRRILRALEFFYAYGIPISTAQQRFYSPPPPMEVLWITLLPERRELYRRINERTRQMWASGLLEETRRLLESGYSKELPALQTIGYAEAVAVLEGELSLPEAIARTAQKTRNFAKRQITWIRHQTSIGTLVQTVDAETVAQLRQMIENTVIRCQ